MAGLIGGDAVSVSVSTAQAYGIQFLSRYLSDYPSKNLTLSEAQAWSSAGIWLVSNWENGTTDYAGGYAAGSRNATVAAQQHHNCGGPADRPIYFSVDTDVDPANAALHAYFQGVCAAIGVGRSGVYGSTGVCTALKNAGLVSFDWRTMSTGWSGGAGYPSEFNVIQTGAFSSSLDRDVSETDDFGQWKVGVSYSGGGTTTGGTTVLSQSDINAVALAVASYHSGNGDPNNVGDQPDVHQTWLTTRDAAEATLKWTQQYPTLDALAAAVALKVWEFENTAAGDTYDAHQRLANIEAEVAAIKARVGA